MAQRLLSRVSMGPQKSMDDSHVTTWKWTSPRTTKPPTTQGLISLFGLFAGLCTVFALVATAYDAWQERAQENWPETIATIEWPSIDSYRAFKSAGGGLTSFIRCRIRYLAGAEEVHSSIRSRSTSLGKRHAIDTAVGRPAPARRHAGRALRPRSQ
jgi:hypothetical protein